MEYNELKASLANSDCDVLELLNSPSFSNDPYKMSKIIGDIFNEPLINFENYKTDEEFQLSTLCTELYKLGVETEGTRLKLQNKFKKMQISQSKIPTSSTILMYDSAKTRADKLGTLIRAKIDFGTAYASLQLLDKNNDVEFYQVLVQLNRCCKILCEYDFTDNTKVEEINLIKKEFLMPLENQIYNSLDHMDKENLDMLKNKFESLDCLTNFNEYLVNYFSKKISSIICQIEQASQTEDIPASNPDSYLWKILSEVFDIWKKTWEILNEILVNCDDNYKIKSSGNGSNFVSSVISQILESDTQWNIISKIFLNSLSCEEEKFMAYLQISKQFISFTEFLNTRGDNAIYECLTNFIGKLKEILGETYQRESKNFLLIEISKITPPENSASRHRHKWLIPFIEDIQRIILQIIHESFAIFGNKFYDILVPSIDFVITELITVFNQKDYLEVKKDINQEICSNKGIGEIAEEKFNSIIVVGYMYNMIETICDALKQTISGNEINGKIINEKHTKDLLQKLSWFNSYVVSNKITAVGNAIIHRMSKEVSDYLKEKENKINISQKLSTSLQNTTSLPNYSYSPQDYMTNLGQRFLQVVNTVTLFLANKDFKLATEYAYTEQLKNDKNKEFKKSSVEGAYLDLWIISNITENVVQYWVLNFQDVCDTNDFNMMKQVYIDAKFLIDVVVDLNLEPCTDLLEICGTLNTTIEQEKK
ncbi:Conserved oligomeric Golgi complex subunit 7 family-containing protein [Strongyloides ratti]|uniref:Conserved oligomeric Golgi complex subunit 7 family-containing protein n=1 Tax=Strongyloides ratti TaxID=34506 RepID=A0A090L645_STRRB|nr:Conserved oligomeric Golgi complex subunit 7 family-containing protein [Strongyloides ratti]CEF63598.1 Conserved oligomeric Golgi complex subunit 7 family-containing protein [Strongyloides ratti]